MKTNLYICSAKVPPRGLISNTKRLRAYPCGTSTSCSCGTLASFKGVRLSFLHT